MGARKARTRSKKRTNTENRRRRHKTVGAHRERLSIRLIFRRNAMKWFLPGVVFLWPMVYLFRLILPKNGYYLGLGNDFILLYYKYKAYLLACLADGHFPLWSPAEGAGYPFYTNPFTQAFYPLNLPLVIWFKISGGYNPWDHQIFTVLGVSIFALGLFVWLRLINGNLRAVLLGALVMSVSFKATEILRFPNAIHTAAWYPWILYALTRIMLSRSLKKAVVAGALLVLFLICLVTGGYPYYVYYGLFLFGPYMLLFLVKSLRLRLFGTQRIHWKRAFVTLAIAGSVALLICAPYLLGIRELMSETIDRAGKDYAYSTKHIFNFEDTLGSLVYPPAASVEGWYFFSITALLLLLLYIMMGIQPYIVRLLLLIVLPKLISVLIILHILRRGAKGSRGEQKVTCNREMQTALSAGNLWVKLFFIIWIGVITYISYGRHSYLFSLLWHYMPGFSSLRVWGRLNIILVPILAWLLSLSYASFESMVVSRKVSTGESRLQLFSPIIMLAVIYAAILCIQIYLIRSDTQDILWARYFEHLSPQSGRFISYGVLAFVVILLVIILRKRIGIGSNMASATVLAVLVAVAALEMHHVGARQWTSRTQKYEQRVCPDVAGANTDSFRFRRTERKDTISLTPRFNIGVVPDWYFGRYNKFLRETEDELQARRVLLGLYDGRKIFFSESVEHSTIDSFLRDAVRYKNPGLLQSYTGDELHWQIDAPVEGYLSFIDNWDRNWKAFVDDKPVEMVLLFGTFKSVRLTPGQHSVKFSYQPGLM